ncbi:MAG: hypothetical protein HQM13_16740 [SAR324 cluster bacterium]|nr:hypothetical protein [SAR324 cluster bacterium]
MDQGYEALERLEFKLAGKAFQDVVEIIEDHQEALSGLSLCEHWQVIFQKRKHLPPINACEFLWNAITSFNFETTPLSMVLKKAILKKLSEDVKGIDPDLFSDSGLCLGQIFRELEEYSKAIEAFAPLLERYPHEPHLLVHYGNTLWQAEETIQAKINYIKALLIAPSEISALPIHDQEISELVNSEGPYMAPIFEWLHNGMPLLEMPKIQGENLEHIGALEIYYLLLEVNEMKKKGDFEQMVTVRQELKHQAPDIFSVYMEKVKSA